MSASDRPAFPVEPVLPPSVTTPPPSSDSTPISNPQSASAAETTAVSNTESYQTAVRPKPTSSTTKPATVPTPLAPWERTKPSKSTNNHSATDLNYPENDASSMQHFIGKIISTETPSTSRRRVLLSLLIFVLLVCLPVSLTLTLAYRNWPSIIPIPEPIQRQVDYIILRTPLPKPPSILFRLIQRRLQDTPRLKLQLIGQTNQPISRTKAELLLSAEYDRTQPQVYLRGHIEWKSATQPRWSLLLEAHGTPQDYFTYVRQFRPLSQLDFSSVNQLWIEWRTPDTTRYGLSGQQALNQLRAVKLEQLQKQLLNTLITQAQIEYQPETLPDYYLIKLTLQPSQILNFYQRLVQIYQETRIENQLPDSVLQTNLQLLANSIQTPMEFTLLVRREDVFLENITFEWQTSPPVNETFAGLRLEKEQFHHKLTVQIQPVKQLTMPPRPTAPQPAEQFYWPEMIRLSLLQPFLPTSEF